MCAGNPGAISGAGGTVDGRRRFRPRTRVRMPQSQLPTAGRSRARPLHRGDGPRWFLRAVLSGQAAIDDAVPLAGRSPALVRRRAARRPDGSPEMLLAALARKAAPTPAPAEQQPESFDPFERARDHWRGVLKAMSGSPGASPNAHARPADAATPPSFRNTRARPSRSSSASWLTGRLATVTGIVRGHLRPRTKCPLVVELRDGTPEPDPGVASGCRRISGIEPGVRCLRATGRVPPGRVAMISSTRYTSSFHAAGGTV